MKKRSLIFYKKIFVCIFFVAGLFFCNRAFSQRGNVLEQVKGRMGNIGKGVGSSSKDTSGFKHRDDLADSITISYRYLDSLRSNRLDSSLNDFNRYFSVPPNYVTLGNNGSAAYPVLFSPLLKAGWDAGFHAYDVYRFTIEDTRFFKTTRPFSQITYLLGSGKEQFINVLHTQNIKPNWNFGFEYRLISAPGFFQTQNNSHNNYRLFSNYQGKKKRYSVYFILNGNHLAASENGGIQNDSFLYDVHRAKRVAVPVNLGGDVSSTFNAFSTKVSTGIIYKDFTFFLRQSYDFGKRDSIQINDSTKEYLFYPKLRCQHTINYTTSDYQFKDIVSGYNTLTYKRNAELDSILLKQWYDTTLAIDNSTLSFQVEDKWKVLTNDFSIRQFPETKNPAQFIEAGLRVENIKGIFYRGTENYLNIVLHGEYRNKTRNRKWDALANGEFYATGYNAGDYFANAMLTRFLNEKLGNVRLAFQNVNRTPSFIFNSVSSFNFKNNLSLKKENITVFTASAENPKFSLWFRNISIANYSYFKNYYQTDQYSSLINITQVQASKVFHVKKKINLYSDFIVQQAPVNSPVRVPIFYTRQRLALEGVYFKNLNLSTGFDVNYNTPYKANNFSPVMGQFFPQDSTTINNLPNISYFFNFRIKSFTGLIKLENLNTINFANGLVFTNNNFAAPLYPTPGLIFRIGVKWAFVN